LDALLPIDPPGLGVPLWLDVIAAGVAVACYSVFFSTPLKMLPGPVAVGNATAGDPRLHDRTGFGLADR
jgi:hypothetical protein